MAPPIILSEGLTKDYHLGPHTVHALRGVSVTIERGDFVAVMGPSGSGKSTFMNLLGCLDRPTAGRCVLDGEDVAGLSPDALAQIRNARIGFVFQQFNLLPRTSAIENVELPLLYAGVPARARRRVAIARALVNDPAVILADEPTGNLDTRTSVEVLALLQTLNRQGLTIVLVTHELDIAAYASRHLVFRDGRLRSDEAVASPRDAAAALDALPADEEDAA